jgi:hypothetical protein
VRDPSDKVVIEPHTTSSGPLFASGHTITVPDGPTATFCDRAFEAAAAGQRGRQLARATFGELRIVVCVPAPVGKDVLWLRSLTGDDNSWNAVTVGPMVASNHVGERIGAIVLDAQHAWIVDPSPIGETSSLWRTTDGGGHWSKLTLPVPEPTVAFTSATDGTVVGIGGEKFVTRDGGDTWTKVETPTSTTVGPPPSLPLTRCQTTDVVDLGGTVPKVPARPTSISASDANRLGQYTDRLGRVAVLAPRGWSCAASFGADGSGLLVAYPAGGSFDFTTLTHDGPIVAAFTDGACTGCAAASLCGAFGVASTAMGPCSRPAVAGETRTKRDTHTIEFVDPPGVEGVRMPKGAGTTASGAAIWFPDGPTTSWVVTCALGPNVDPLCQAITDDFVSRHRTAR